MKEVIEGWIARDEDKSLWFHYVKPKRENEIEKTWWGSNDKTFRIYDWDFPQFKDLKWEDEPRKVLITIETIE